MADRTKLDNLEEEFIRKTDGFNQQLNAASLYYTQGEKFNSDYSSLVNDVSRKLNDTKNYFSIQQAQLADQEREARDQAKRDEEFVRDIERNIAEKTAEIDTKRAVFEANKAKLGEELKALDAKKLGKFKVKPDTELHRFFSGIHRAFNFEGEFDWAKFKSAFEKDKTVALQAKLGNPDFKTLDQSKINTLAALKNDQFYDDLANKPKEGAGLLPLVNYLKYVVPAATAHAELTGLQKDIETIRTDGPVREESAKAQHALANDLKASLQYLNALNERFVNNLEGFKNEGSRKAEYEDAFRQHVSNRQQQLSNYASVIASTR